MISVPTIDTARLRLRPLYQEDAKDIFGIFSSEKVTQYYDLETFSEIGEAASWTDLMIQRASNGSGIRWGITLHGDPQVIGTCGFTWRRQNFSAMLGYDLADGLWGQGYVTEAVEAVVDSAFKDVAPFKLNRIKALTYPENAPSIAVLEKVGFEQEGLLKQWGYWKNAFHDLLCFSLLRHSRLGHDS